jgi:hypothetical protein
MTFKEVNYGTKFIFERGVVLCGGGTTLRARHIKSDIWFETTDETGIYNDASWFKPKNVVLILDYNTDILIITKKSTGQQIKLKIDTYYFHRADEKVKAIYYKYLAEKEEDLKRHKTLHSKDYYKPHVDMIKTLIDDLYDAESVDSLNKYIDRLRSLIVALER